MQAALIARGLCWSEKEISVVFHFGDSRDVPASQAFIYPFGFGGISGDLGRLCRRSGYLSSWVATRTASRTRPW